MVIQIVPSAEEIEQQRKRTRVLNTYVEMQAWPHWGGVYLNCIKETTLSYEAFAAAVQAGDASPRSLPPLKNKTEEKRLNLSAFK